MNAYQVIESILAQDDRVDQVIRQNVAEDGERRLLVRIDGEDHFLIIS